MATVALDKTQGWMRTTGKQARDLLAQDAVASERLLALHALLAEDVTPMVALYRQRGKEPAIPETRAAIRILREHGYPLAANVLGTLLRDLSEERVLAWASIPQEKRAPIDEYMLTRYAAKGKNRQALVKVALQLFLKPPEKCPVDVKAIYELALLFGKDTGLLNLPLAQQWLYAGKTAEAKQLLLVLVAQRDSDFALPRQAAYLLLNTRDANGAAAVYRRALGSVREPYVREVRLDYLAFLQRWGSALAKPAAAAAPHAGGPGTEQPDATLIIPPADKDLCDGNYAAAAAGYTARLRETTTPLEVRLDAWAGLLDSDPAAGLDAAATVTSALAQQPPATREALLRWCGWQVDRLLEREIPSDVHNFSLPEQRKFRPIHELAGWETKLAALFDHLGAVAGDVLLLPDPERYDASLRPTAALLDTLAGRGEDAYRALSREIAYDIPPPSGGWTTFDGSPDAHAAQPHHARSPFPGEEEHTLQALAEVLAHYQAPLLHDGLPLSGPGLPLSTAAARHLSAMLATEQDPIIITAHLRELAIAVTMAVTALDPTPAIQHTDQPPPPVRPVDPAQFAPIESAIRTALANDAVARQLHPLLQDGLLASLQIASNPHFTEILFALLTTTLDRYAAVTPDAKLVRYEAHHLATVLANRPIYDMKPYAKRLREQYLREP